MLSSWTACKKPEPILVPIGEVKVVGTSQVVGSIEKGIPKWKEGIDVSKNYRIAIMTFDIGVDIFGAYNIVTPAFVIKLIDLAYEVKRLQLELKKCQELLEKK